jgi:hypothetical protein
LIWVTSGTRVLFPFAAWGRVTDVPICGPEEWATFIHEWVSRCLKSNIKKFFASPAPTIAEPTLQGLPIRAAVPLASQNDDTRGRNRREGCA